MNRASDIARAKGRIADVVIKKASGVATPMVRARPRKVASCVTFVLDDARSKLRQRNTAAYSMSQSRWACRGRTNERILSISTAVTNLWAYIRSASFGVITIVYHHRHAFPVAAGTNYLASSHLRRPRLLSAVVWRLFFSIRSCHDVLWCPWSDFYRYRTLMCKDVFVWLTGAPAPSALCL